MRGNKNEILEIKASGGISSYHDAIKLIEKGVTRIGTSHGVDIMNHKLNSHAGKITLSIGNKVTFEKIKTILKF